MKIGKIAIVAVFVAICIVLMFACLKTAYTAFEVGECQKWAKNAAEIPGFYYTDWQKAQCEFHGMPVDK